MSLNKQIKKRVGVVFGLCCIIAIFIWQIFFLDIASAVPTTIVAFEPSALAGSETTFNATTNDANLNASVLSRGAGINPSALSGAFSAKHFTAHGTKDDAINNNDYFQFAISAKTGYTVSLNSIDINIRRSNNGPNAYQWQYSLDNFVTAGIDVGPQESYTGVDANGLAMPQIDLLEIASLQNIAAGTTVTFRLYMWGASNASGTFAIGRLSGDDLAIAGQVVDVASPTLHLPANITAEATGPDGAIVTYAATADDASPLHPNATCSPASGSTFSLGQTAVNCSATDAAGNIATGSFNITVQDKTRPIITLNGSASIDLYIGDSYTELGATATDLVDGNNTVIISGDTVSALVPAVFRIKYDATDTAGNPAVQVIRTVYVSDVTAPVINAISNVSVEATGPAGAVATYDAVTATDNVDGIVSATCLPASDSVFPIGVNTVSCAATDSSGNVGTGTGLIVTITDNTLPIVTILPATQTIEATEAAGAVANFIVSATDIVDGDISASAVCNNVSGSIFALGNNTLTCVSTDAHGNIGTGSAEIIIKDTTAPIIIETPENIIAEAASNLGAIVIYSVPTATDLVDGADDVACSPASGATFAIGDTTVTCNSTDLAENTATPTSFTITVQDKTAPEIETHPDIVVETKDSSGAVVTFTNPLATDEVDANVDVACSPASGATLPVGDSTILCTATDDFSNSTTSTFKVTVNFVEPPAPSGGGGGGGGYYIPPIPPPQLPPSPPPPPAPVPPPPPPAPIPEPEPQVAQIPEALPVIIKKNKPVEKLKIVETPKVAVEAPNEVIPLKQEIEPQKPAVSQKSAENNFLQLAGLLGAANNIISFISNMFSKIFNFFKII